MSEVGYRCWAGNFHPAHHIPEDATDDTLLSFHCDCMGSIAQAPPVRERLDRGKRVTLDQARNLAMWWTPPRNPVVRVGDLVERGDSAA